MFSLLNCFLKRAHFALLFLGLTMFSASLHAQNCNSNNFAANQTVVASEANEIAANLVDGNISTDWFSGSSSGKWIYVDLGASRNLCKLTPKWDRWGPFPAVTVQGSNNASVWTDLDTIVARTSALHGADYEYLDKDLSSVTTAYRYVRLYFTAGAAWFHLKEIEVYIKETVLSPIVNITSPANDSNFVQGSTITISANASEAGGSISKVEFFANGANIGQVLSSPYNFNWTNVQAGDYEIIARAHDPSGNVGVSNPIIIHVADPSTGWSLTGNTGTTTSHFIGTTDAKPLVFKTGSTEAFRISSSGQVSIGTTDSKGYKFAVNGDAIFTRIKVKLNSAWPDFVFEKNYKLPSFKELENYINQHNHLPGVPSAVIANEQGLDVGDNQAILLRKIEELTLYVLQLNTSIEQMRKEVEKLKTENAFLKKK